MKWLACVFAMLVSITVLASDPDGFGEEEQPDEFKSNRDYISHTQESYYYTDTNFIDEDGLVNVVFINTDNAVYGRMVIQNDGSTRWYSESGQSYGVWHEENEWRWKNHTRSPYLIDF